MTTATATVESARAEFEAARVGLIEKLTPELRAEEAAIRKLRIEQRDLLAKRHEKSQAWYPKELEAIRDRLHQIGKELPERENALRALNGRLEAIRTGHSSELFAHSVRQQAAERSYKTGRCESAEATYRRLITPEIQAATAELIAVIGERAATHVILKASVGDEMAARFILKDFLET